MAVIETPPADVCTAYRPVLYKTEQISAIPILYALCAVQIDTIQHFLKVFPYQIDGNTYRFKFDLSELVVQSTAPLGNRSLPFVGETGFNLTDCVDSYKDPSAVVSYFGESPTTGLPYLLTGLSDTLVGPSAIVTTTVQQAEDYQLSRFLAPLADWLSWSLGQEVESIGYSEYRPACWLDLGYRFPALRFDGPRFVVPRFLLLPNLSVGAVRSMNLCPDEVRQQIAILPPDIQAGFSVSVGYLTIENDTSTFVQTHKEAQIKVVEGCKNGRLAFLNRLGGVDVLNFKGRAVRTLEISSSSARFPLPFDNSASQPFGVQDRGRQRLQVEATETANYGGQVYAKNNNLLEDLRTSPEVYIIDQSGPLQAVTVEDAELVTSDNKALISAAVKVKLAQDRIIQR